MKRSLLFPLLFLVCFVALAAYLNQGKPRLLILHSYAPDFSWVREIDRGLDQALGGEYCALRRFCLDTKHHPDEAYCRRIGAQARRFIERWDPDVIIAFDDNAQEYVCRYYVDHPRRRIVCGGINADPSRYGYDRARNVSGILERLQLAAAAEFIRLVLPRNQRRLVHLSDASETSGSVRGELERFDWTPYRLIASRLCRTFPQWQAAVREAEQIGDILLITHYHTIRRGENDPSVVPPAEVIAWTMENCKLPSLGFWTFFVEDGGAMAVALSGQEQGEEAGKTAIGLLRSGARQAAPAFVPSRRWVPAFSVSRTRAQGIGVPRILEVFAAETGHLYP